jgi:hypothetical protein
MLRRRAEMLQCRAETSQPVARFPPSCRPGRLGAPASVPGPGPNLKHRASKPLRVITCNISAHLQYLSPARTEEKRLNHRSPGAAPSHHCNQLQYRVIPSRSPVLRGWGTDPGQAPVGPAPSRVVRMRVNLKHRSPESPSRSEPSAASSQRSSESLRVALSRLGSFRDMPSR